jgi:hypothetical protein
MQLLADPLPNDHRADAGQPRATEHELTRLSWRELIRVYQLFLPRANARQTKSQYIQALLAAGAPPPRNLPPGVVQPVVVAPPAERPIAPLHLRDPPLLHPGALELLRQRVEVDQQADTTLFPPALGQEKAAYASAHEAMGNAYQPQACCCVCSRMLPSVVWEGVKLEQVPWVVALPLLDKVKRSIPGLGGSTHFLDEAGLLLERDVVTSPSICSVCLAELRAPGHKPPKFSLANGLDVDHQVTAHLPLLTWMEEATISRVRFSCFIVKLERFHRDSQLGYKGRWESRGRRSGGWSR